VQARQEMDADRDTEISNSEGAAWAESTCRSATDSLALQVNASPVNPRPVGVGLAFAPGQAGLSTLRLVCTYSAEYAAVPNGSSVQFSDTSYSSRQGWREIVVRPAGVTLGGVDEYLAGSSDRLRAYPSDAGSAIKAQSSVTFEIVGRSGSSAIEVPTVADAVTLGSPADQIVVQGSAPAIVPGGVSDLPGELTSIIGAGDLSLPALLTALLLAIVVGAFHAATPGHGKTLMAAYLVGSRGTVRNALALGLTVTVSHTIGVLVLGAIVLVAGAALPSERLLPILGLASGIVVTLLGIAFFVQRWKQRAHDRQHEHKHGAEHPHDHDHDHHHAPDDGAGWHSHGLVRHTHLPDETGPLRRRNLIALGLVGGLVPSASAILILVGSIAAGRPAFGMALTIAFGAGMAAVLVGVGVLLVRARSLVERLPSRGVGRALAYAPVATALVFVIVGVAITIQATGQLR